MTLAQLKKYNFSNGLDIKDGHPLTTTIPTLDEFLDWFKEGHGTANIELKTDLINYPGLEQAVYQLIQDHQMEERVIISSFNHETIVDMKKIAPELAYAFLNMSTLSQPDKYCRDHGVDNYHPSLVALTQRAYQDCCNHKINTNVFTVNDAQDIQVFIDMGVTGIISNDVETAVALASVKN